MAFATFDKDTLWGGSVRGESGPGYVIIVWYADDRTARFVRRADAERFR
ncbi:MAG: hypothetical protein IT160_10980 [Bryobacterales bacterium]|nr:hypothetical protein [Bryobacterales bacterium]